MSRELEVVVSNIATIDVENIRDYLSHHSTAAARQFVSTFGQWLDTLSATPFVGSRPRPTDPDLRFFVVGKYVIYYRVTNDIVWIQRVLHGSQDAQRIL